MDDDTIHDILLRKNLPGWVKQIVVESGLLKNRQELYGVGGEYVVRWVRVAQEWMARRKAAMEGCLDFRQLAEAAFQAEELPRYLPIIAATVQEVLEECPPPPHEAPQGDDDVICIESSWIPRDVEMDDVSNFFAAKLNVSENQQPVIDVNSQGANGSGMCQHVTPSGTYDDPIILSSDDELEVTSPQPYELEVTFLQPDIIPSGSVPTVTLPQPEVVLSVSRPTVTLPQQPESVPLVNILTVAPLQRVSRPSATKKRKRVTKPTAAPEIVETPDIYSYIHKFGGRMRLSGEVVRRAIAVCQKTKGIVLFPRKKDYNAMAGACIYVASRLEKQQRTMMEIVSACQLQGRGRIHLYFMRMKKRGIDVGEAIKSVDLIPHFCTELHFEDNVSGAAVYIATRVDQSGEVAKGRGPVSVAVAAIYTVFKSLKRCDDAQKIVAHAGTKDSVIRPIWKDVVAKEELLFPNGYLQKLAESHGAAKNPHSHSAQLAG